MLLCFQFISVTKNVREKFHIWHSICMHCCTSSGPSQTLPRSFLRAVWWWELGWASSVVPGIFLSSIPVPALLHGVAQLWMVSKSSPEPWLPPRSLPWSSPPQMPPHLPLMMVTEGSAHLAPAASPFVVLLSSHCQLNGVFFPSLLTLLFACIKHDAVLWTM